MYAPTFGATRIPVQLIGIFFSERVFEKEKILYGKALFHLFSRLRHLNSILTPTDSMEQNSTFSAILSNRKMVIFWFEIKT